MTAIRRLFKRGLARYFDLMPIPSSFQKIARNHVLPVIITQSSSIIVEAALTSFAKRSGCQFSGLRTYTPQEPGRDVLCAINMHDPKEVVKLIEHLPNSRSIGANNLYFSTLNIFRGKGPMRSHPSYTMKLMDYFSLLFGPILRCRFLLVVFGEPQLLPSLEHPTVNKLIRHFKLDFYSNLKMVRGTPFQKFSTQEQIVLSGKDYEMTLNRLSKSLNTTSQKLHSSAKKAFRKLAARPRAWVFIPAAIVTNFILRRLFTDIQVRGIPELAKALKKDTVVLVPMHRSHLDYILIGSVLYEANLNPPLIAAGMNLSFWPFGTIIRALGGYFVKRSARHDRIHSLVLKRYIGYLVKRGHLQEFFIEGGRSRSGRMRPPKLGLLKTMVNAYLKKERKDVLFVPVSISYEHVIEDSEYAKENTGSDKTKESLVSLFRARGLLRQKYKEVIIHFGDAVRFSEYKESHDKRQTKSLLVEDLGYEIVRKIEGYSNLGLRSLACLSIFLTPNYGMEGRKLALMIRALSRAAEWYRLMESNPSYALPTPALQRFIDNPEEYNHDFQSAGVVNRAKYLDKDLYFIPGRIRYTAEFYKNSIYHIFLPLGFFSLAHAIGKNITTDSIRPWFDLLQHELLLPNWEDYQIKLAKYHEILKEEKIITQAANGKFSFSEEGKLFLIPGLLFPLIESSLWIAKCLENSPFIERTSPNDQSRKRRVYDYTSFMRVLQQQLVHAKYAGEFSRTEVSSLSSLTSTMEGMNARGIISFQERFGKRTTLILEHAIDDEYQILAETHKMLARSMLIYPEAIPNSPLASDAPSDNSLSNERPPIIQ